MRMRAVKALACGGPISVSDIRLCLEVLANHTIPTDSSSFPPPPLLFPPGRTRKAS